MIVGGFIIFALCILYQTHEIESLTRRVDQLEYDKDERE